MIIPIGDVHNRPGTARIATWTILILNVLVYLLELQIQFEGGDGDKALRNFLFKYGAVPAVVTLPPGETLVRGTVPIRMMDQEGRYYFTPTEETVRVYAPHWLGLFTALFLHASFLHIAGNMLFFWIFADNVEDMLGTVWFIILYFACGIMANVAQVAIQPNSLIPCIGASGAIAGVLGAYLVLFPWNKVRLWYWFLFIFWGVWQVSALYVLGLWFVWQLLAQTIVSTLPTATGGVAYMAHVGGFVTGIILVLVFPKREMVKEYYKSIFAREE